MESQNEEEDMKEARQEMEAYSDAARQPRNPTVPIDVLGNGLLVKKVKTTFYELPVLLFCNWC